MSVCQVRRVTYAAFGDSNSYIVFFDDTNKAILFDCGKSYKTYSAFCEKHGLEVEAVFLTHGHIDHIAEGALWKNRGAKIYISREDAQYLNSDLNLASRFRVVYTPYEADVLLEGGETIDFHGHKVHVIATPGHTRGGLSYAIEGLLFTGDTLFADKIGRTDFYGGDFFALLNSLKKIIALPKNTIVYPGHGEWVTVGKILEKNPYVRSLNV